MAKPRKRKPTPNQVEFKKQRRRIQNIISRSRRAGIILPNVDELITPPQRITKAYLQKLKALKPENIRERGQYIDTNTGELLSYSKAKKQKVKVQKPKLPTAPEPEKVDIKPLYLESQIIYILRTYFIHSRNREVADLLLSLLEKEISQYGETEVARRISQAPDNLKELADVVGYDSKSEHVIPSAQALALIITGGKVSSDFQAKLSEAMTAAMPWSFRRR